MKSAYLKPEHFDHVFYTYITFYGSQKKVTCAFDEPDDVHVWLYDNDYNITYDTTREDYARIESFAHEILEQVWNAPSTLKSPRSRNQSGHTFCVLPILLLALRYLS